MTQQARHGELYLILSAAFFALMAVAIKLVPTIFSGPFISVVRFAVGIGLGLAYLYLTHAPFKIQRKTILILRGLFGSVAMVLYFMAIQMTGSGRATLLLNTFPIFVALFGYLLFRETISAIQFASITVCVIGVVLVFYDGSSYSFWGNLFGLSAGVIRGISVHLIKRSAASNHPVIVYLSACIWGMLLLPFMAHEVVNLHVLSTILLLSIGILAFIAQLMMTYGIRYVSTIKASLLSYATIPLTIFLGFLIGEELRGKFFLGIVFIFIGLLLNSGFGEMVSRNIVASVARKFPK